MIGLVKNYNTAGMLVLASLLAAGCGRSTADDGPDAADTLEQDEEADLFEDRLQDLGPETGLDPDPHSETEVEEDMDVEPDAPDMDPDLSDMTADEDMEDEPPPPPYPCNGAEEMCYRRYSEVAYATAHNAMSSQDEGWVAPNHYHAMADQLEAGVRGFMLDTHYFRGDAYLCHGSCLLGSKPLADGLLVVREFLDANPYEVLTIIFESYISAADTETAFHESGLDAYTYAHETGTDWPTLFGMIESNTRVVVFTDNEGGEPAWYHAVWEHCWETHYHFESVDALSCAINRGEPGNPLFILNHFLTNPVAYPALAEQVNYNPLFIDRALVCRDESGRIPNFITVDFYSIGDLLSVVDTLNGL